MVPYITWLIYSNNRQRVDHVLRECSAPKNNMYDPVICLGFLMLATAVQGLLGYPSGD